MIFQIEDDGGIGGKYTCVQFVAINKDQSILKTTVLFRLYLKKGKTGNFVVTSSELYLCFDQFTQYQVQKKTYLLVFLTVVGGKVNHQSCQEFCCVWGDMRHECLGQSGIWTSLDGEL